MKKVYEEKKAVNVEYPLFEKWKWMTYTSKDASLLDFLNLHKDVGFFFIGTDSKNAGKASVFTTALVAYEKGRGGNILIHRDKTDVVPSMRQRLLLEAMRSLECAWHIEELIPENTMISIHLDVNPNLRYQSSMYKEELVTLIASQGYDVVHKPYSWAATQIAHNKCN